MYLLNYDKYHPEELVYDDNALAAKLKWTLGLITTTWWRTTVNSMAVLMMDGGVRSLMNCWFFNRITVVVDDDDEFLLYDVRCEEGEEV